MNRSLLRHGPLAAGILLAVGIAGWFVWSRSGERNGGQAGSGVDANPSPIRSQGGGDRTAERAARVSEIGCRGIRRPLERAATSIGHDD